MPNENCLAGMRCPKCGSYGEFRIATHCFTDWCDDGTGDSVNYEIDAEGPCVCLSCYFEGKVPEFQNTKMTWKHLRDRINAMSPEQQETDVTMFDGNDGEYCGICTLRVTEEDDVLDAGHPYLEGFYSIGEEE